MLPPHGQSGRLLSALMLPCRSEHARRALTEREAAAGDKDRQLAELRMQVADLQAKAAGSAGSPPVVQDSRPGEASCPNAEVLLGMYGVMRR